MFQNLDTKQQNSNMGSHKYILAVKTGEAELRALENTPLGMQVLPIIEITRGRRTKKDPNGSIWRRLDRLKEILIGHDVCIDLTSQASLSNEDIDSLFSSENGFENWLNFLNKVKSLFNRIIPAIIIDRDAPALEENLEKQIKALWGTYDSILYRHDIDDPDYLSDVETIFKCKNGQNNKRLIFVFDCAYLGVASWRSCANAISQQLKEISSLCKDTTFVILSTSFPNQVTDIGNDLSDEFELAEIHLYENIKNQFPTLDIVYGDYGSINPIRNDNIVMAHGWVPRIDVSTESEIFYIRKRRVKSSNNPNNVSSYTSTYSDVAREVLSNAKFPTNLDGNWGIQQIRNAADGYAPGANPSFWISVRMSIFIAQQMRRLKI